MLESDLLTRLHALADGTRLRILAMLIERGEVSAQEIAAELGLNDPAKLRRALFDDRLMDRTSDGSRYWRTDFA